MNRVSLLVLTGLTMLPSLAFAELNVTVNPTKKSGPKCYSAAEAEADQGIRIHSELMVIGLNCNHMGKRHGQPLYSMYREFTAKHGKIFAGYESMLIDFFKANGDPNPVASLNTLRTIFANKISNDAAGLRPDIFCSRYAPRILKAAEMSEADVRKWAATIYTSHPVSHPVCAASGK
ncbi:MAG: hypothetical protein WBK55_03290 [Alphaproteobacteria bacterium]